jgi:hypothetical protein
VTSENADEIRQQHGAALIQVLRREASPTRTSSPVRATIQALPPRAWSRRAEYSGRRSTSSSTKPARCPFHGLPPSPCARIATCSSKALSTAGWGEAWSLFAERLPQRGRHRRAPGNCAPGPRSRGYCAWQRQVGSCLRAVIPPRSPARPPSGGVRTLEPSMSAFPRFRRLTLSSRHGVQVAWKTVPDPKLP